MTRSIGSHYNDITTVGKSKFIEHFMVVFVSQAIAMASGLIKALIVPILLGLTDFGYWQIYVFYTVYIGAFTLGYGDGIYLRYGGCKLADLPLRRLRAANAIYIAILLVGAAAAVTIAYMNDVPQRQLIFVAVAANILVLGVTSNISLTLQATNELKSFAFLSTADKVFFVLALFALVQESFRTFQFLIAVDLVSKFIVMGVLMYRYRPLFFGSFVKTAEGVKEAVTSMGAGAQLLLANLSGMLVLGVGRIIVEYFGSLESYSHYAFSVSLSSIVLLSISALSIVIYPILKSTSRENYLGYFNKTNEAYAIVAPLMLTGYFPGVAYIEHVAKEYAPVLQFLNAVFIITVLQGKMQLVNNTYYKALRLERQMLVANFSSLVIVMLLSFIGFMYTHSVLSIAYAALVTMLIQVYASEIFLRKHMGGRLDLAILMEVLSFALFLLFTMMLTPIAAAASWVGFVVTILILKRQELRQLCQWLSGTQG